eukprot:GHVO01003755.1.p1 GENE.GHVO01003755.1~~GHVO01003755.1.p1  ORF type:complete len:165 (+),score=19.92 GHVO01003755.1:48-497(+)
MKNLSSLWIRRIDLLLDGSTDSFLAESSEDSPNPPRALHAQETTLNPRSVRLQHLFGAIAKCRLLREINLDNMQIGDDLMSCLCGMIVSLNHLNELYIAGNELTVDSLQELSSCLQQNVLTTLDLRGIEGIENSEHLRDLKRHVRHLMY